ncbi:MAG: PaaX family transcriptional regulator C-terminal domain-containing protein [Nesterenkonia sp.]|nr:PaaX family transcriptional regulator C-terminal domain-containing protein [Nesterenkonia sp.]
MKGPVDEVGARTGGGPSLVLTVVGLYLRRVGGWMSTSSLVRLAEEVGSPAPRTRSAIARLKRRGVLISERRGGASGYGFDPAADAMFRRGDRRIFGPRSMGADEPWCLTSCTVGEDRRSLRHQLRRRLRWIGCGAAAPGLWICPDHLSAEVEGILADLGLRDRATLFRVDELRTPGPAAEAAAQWWDLEELGAMHRRFQGAVSGLLPSSEAIDDVEAFRRYILGMDAWRDIPYLDPGLPAELLPDDWPGTRSVELFHALQSELADGSERHVRRVTTT